MFVCSELGTFNEDVWEGFCWQCDAMFNSIRKITVDDLKNVSRVTSSYGWGETPYEERQVYAAMYNVPVEVCLECPYLKKRDDFGRKLGTCCYCRNEAKEFGMKGVSNCTRVMFEK